MRFRPWKIRADVRDAARACAEGGRVSHAELLDELGLPYAITYAPSAAWAIRKLDRHTVQRLLGALASAPGPPGATEGQQG